VNRVEPILANLFAKVDYSLLTEVLITDGLVIIELLGKA